MATPKTITDLMAILGIKEETTKTPETATDFAFMEIPEQVRKGRGLSKEMQNAQATLKLHAGQSARVKVCASRSAASTAASQMRKSPHWEGFEVVARDKAVFATFTKKDEE